MRRFDYFAVLGGMRTGSNLLEEELNSVEGLRCLGEAFNPHFVGYPNKTSILDIDLVARDRDPARLLSRIGATRGALSGFRLFQDHDDRVLTACLADPRAAKIVLTRNPVDSYVSLKIARKTGQWWLGDAGKAKRAKAWFSDEEFNEFLRERRDFYLRINRALQTSGQTAFYVDYSDLRDPGVVAGLVRFLGVDGNVDAHAIRARVQNPEPLSEKVENFEDMEAALAGADFFDLGRIPSFEPSRGPGVPGFMVAERLGLLFMPLRGGPSKDVEAWLTEAGGARPSKGLKQRDIRRWKRQTPGHRSFTVVTHPVARAHSVFLQRILQTGEEGYPEIRASLRERYDLPIPETDPPPDWTDEAHRAAFLSFLHFLKANLGGQTGIRIDPDWASQAGLLQYLAEVMVPDRVFRAEALQADLPGLLRGGGPAFGARIADARLQHIYDREIEAAARAAYSKDYMMFGFGAWS